MKQSDYNTAWSHLPLYVVTVAGINAISFHFTAMLTYFVDVIHFNHLSHRDDCCTYFIFSTLYMVQKRSNMELDATATIASTSVAKSYKELHATA